MPAESFDELFSRAARAMKEGFADNALVPATEAAKAAPDRWEPRLLLARIWIGMGRPDRALSDARSAIQLAGTLPPEEQAQAQDVIARASLAVGDLPAAEAALRSLADLPSAVRLQALLMSSGRLPEARDHAKACAGRLSSQSSAFSLLAQALEGGIPGDSAVELAAGELELEVGLLTEAQRRFQSVLARDTSSERAQEGLRWVAAGGPPPKAARRVVPIASPRRSPFSRALAVVTVVLGMGTVVWGRTHLDALRAMGRDPLLLDVAGYALMGTGLLVAFVELMLSRSVPAGRE